MLLTKKIMPTGRYRVRSPKGPALAEFDQDYLSKVADISNKMIGAGLRIPAPFDHHKEATPRTEVEINAAKSAFENAGYWTNFWVAPDDKGELALFGALDAPGSKDEPGTPAYKALHTNKEVSVSINNNFKDGLDRTWTDGLMHVALVHHAVVPDQEPFKEAPDNVTVVNMSMLEPGSDEESLVNELKAMLPSIDIVLPASTNVQTFLRDLLVAISNRSKQSGSSELEPVPIYMSLGDPSMALSKEQAESLVATKAINPTTKQPFTMEDLGFKPATPADTTKLAELQASLTEKDSKLSAAMNMLQAMKQKLIDDTKASIESRLNALVKDGIVTKDFVDAQLRPQLEFQMSIVDGKIASHPLEMVLSTLEAQPRKDSKGGVPAGAVVEFNDQYQDGDATPEQMEESFKLLEAEGLI